MQHMLPGSRLRAALLVAVASAFVGTAAFAQMNGAIFTTDEFGSTNINLYDNKEDVHINGGPAHPGAAGLPLGEYYIQVTSPNGDLLGTSDWVSPGWDPTPIKVISVGSGNGGAFEYSYRLWDIVMYQQGQTLKPGYKTSGNPGGVYKVWVSQNPAFPGAETKTDNFRLRQNPNQTEPVEINAYKYYDNDNSGDLSAGDQPIPGWRIELRRASNGNLVLADYTDSSGKVTFLVNDDGTAYNVVEVMPLEGTSGPNVYWFALTQTSFPVIATNNPAPADIEFLNIAKELREVNGFGLTKGFWHNQNGSAMMAPCYPQWANDLNAMCLRWPNGDLLQIPLTGHASAHLYFAGWIVGEGTEGNRAYALSTQLAAIYLNTICGPLSLIQYELLVKWNGVLTPLSDLFQDAVDLLCDYPTAYGSSPEAQAMNALQSYFDGMNNNKDANSGPNNPFAVYYWYPLPFIPPFSYV